VTLTGIQIITSLAEHNNMELVWGTDIGHAYLESYIKEKGHHTKAPINSIYSVVVTRAGIWIVTFLAEHNNMQLWGTDIGNAYLESYTTEKGCFTAWPEFVEFEGHILTIKKALYSLRSRGARWYDRLYDTLKAMTPNPSKMDADIWMRTCRDHYKYIACYMDDLMIASKDPKGIIDALQGAPNKFKFKGTGPVTFHLGCDFLRE
jgi:Reverse transcriptase (RNA-dependent DNA polymerase)